MKFISSKTFAIIVCVVLGIAVFFYFVGGQETYDDDALLVSESMAPTEIQQDLLKTLRQIESISLDGELFQSEMFTNLDDFSKPISPEPSGRPNPFAPLPGVKSSVSN